MSENIFSPYSIYVQCNTASWNLLSNLFFKNKFQYICSTCTTPQWVSCNVALSYIHSSALPYFETSVIETFASICTCGRSSTLRFSRMVWLPRMHIKIHLAPCKYSTLALWNDFERWLHATRLHIVLIRHFNHRIDHLISCNFTTMGISTYKKNSPSIDIRNKFEKALSFLWKVCPSFYVKQRSNHSRKFGRSLNGGHDDDNLR